jgi:hypothetical protein
MTTRNNMTLLVASLLGLGLTACGGLEDATPPDDLPPGSTTGGEDNTFDHENGNPFDVIDRLEVEGPLTYSSRVPSCAKMRYDTIGRVLRSLGVDTADAAPLSAGQLYRDGINALGAPKYAARTRENLGITTSGASRLFDIFVAAADNIVTAMPTLQRCTVGGVGASMFDGDVCRLDGITCLLGVPATQQHFDFCNLAVTSASTPAAGKTIAVAALLAAAHTCE